MLEEQAIGAGKFDKEIEGEVLTTKVVTGVAPNRNSLAS